MTHNIGELSGLCYFLHHSFMSIQDTVSSITCTRSASTTAADLWDITEPDENRKMEKGSDLIERLI